jgi:hypothetical protein
MLLAYFWQSIPETPKQLDALDADGALQGLEIYGWRRVRQVRRVQLEFIIPPGIGPFATLLSLYLCPGKFLRFYKGLITSATHHARFGSVFEVPR